MLAAQAPVRAGLFLSPTKTPLLPSPTKRPRSPTKLPSNRHANRQHSRMAALSALALAQCGIFMLLFSSTRHGRGAVISVTYTEETTVAAVPLAAGAPALVAAVAELKRQQAGSAEFRSMPVEEIMERIEAAMAKEDEAAAKPLGLDSASLCRLAALKASAAAAANATSSSEAVVFHAPLVVAVGPGVILTTYFNSRIDPLRCWKHDGGRIHSDSFEYIQDWYSSVERLGLPAVVFHESLTPQFVAQAATRAVRFQRVALGRPAWSLVDERWAVYADWLRSPAAARVQYVLHVDISDSVISRNPFKLFEASAADYDLWVNLQRHTPWVRQNYAECYGGDADADGAALPAPLASGEVYNAGVVGGKAGAFLDLADALVLEFEGVYGRPARPAWNCDMAALQRALTAGGEAPLARRRVYDRSRPFCGMGRACAEQGECDYYVYHK